MSRAPAVESAVTAGNQPEPRCRVCGGSLVTEECPKRNEKPCSANVPPFPGCPSGWPGPMGACERLRCPRCESDAIAAGDRWPGCATDDMSVDAAGSVPCNWDPSGRRCSTIGAGECARQEWIRAHIVPRGVDAVSPSPEPKAEPEARDARPECPTCGGGMVAARCPETVGCFGRPKGTCPTGWQTCRRLRCPNCEPGVKSEPQDARTDLRKRLDAIPVVKPEDDGPTVRLVKLWLCDACLQGEGEECHTPGCALYLHTPPGFRIAPELYEVVSPAAPPTPCPENGRLRGEVAAVCTCGRQHPQGIHAELETLNAECERLRREVERLIQERLGLCLFRSKVAGLLLDELDPAIYSETEILAGIGGLIARATQPVLPPGHLLVRIEDWEARK